MAPYDVEDVLPSTGMLYFIYDMVEQPWGYDPTHRGAWKVLYCDVNQSELKRIAAELPQPENYDLDFANSIPACAVHFAEINTLPSPWADEIRNVLNEEELELYWNLVDQPDDSSAIHKLLGYPNQIQGDMDLKAQLVSNNIYMGGLVDFENPNIKTLLKGVKDWRLLFQMDYEYPAVQRFGGDGARIYYWIQGEALRQRKFDNVWLAFQTT